SQSPATRRALRSFPHRRSSDLIPSDRAPSALRTPEARAAVEPKDGYDLASLDIFRRSIVQIKDNYVDPSRINPKEMFLIWTIERSEEHTSELQSLTKLVCRHLH